MVGVGVGDYIGLSLKDARHPVGKKKISGSCQEHKSTGVGVGVGRGDFFKLYVCHTEIY